MKEISEDILIEKINDLIEVAIYHGGDPGGPYGSAREELIFKMQQLRTWLSLDGYKIAEDSSGIFYRFVKVAKEDLPSAERSERMTGCNIEMPEGSHWVPIEEEAPPADNVLVTIKWAENDYEVCEMDYYNWKKPAKENVTAWMRMPEPYKEGEE